AAADLGKVVGRLRGLPRLLKPPLGSELQPVGDVVVDGAVHLAEGHAALRAPAGLLGGARRVELVIDFLEVVAARGGLPLLRHALAHAYEAQHPRHPLPPDRAPAATGIPQPPWPSYWRSEFRSRYLTVCRMP